MLENTALIKSSVILPGRKGAAEMNHIVSKNIDYPTGLKEDSMEQEKTYIRKLNRELLVLWQYLVSESLWEDAQEYLEEHRDDELPFEATWTLGH